MRFAVIGLFVLCAALFLAPGATRAATFYNPCANVALTSTATDTPAAITTTFGVGIDPQTCAPFASAKDRPGEWIHNRVVDFTPPGWHIATDADIPDGMQVGEFDSKVVLGLFDQGCNQVLNLNFALLDGTIDRSNPIEPLPAGHADRLKPLSVKDAGGIPAAALQWPAYLTDLAQQSGMDLSKLVARSVGVNGTSFPGTTEILNLLIFEPGATISTGMIIDPQLGYPTVSILQDPTAPSSSEDFVSDFCAPFRSEYTLYDNVNGVPYQQNPGDGVYDFVTYSVPSPDADNDGIENQMDPCPYDPNVSGWDPRGILELGNTPGDNDVDGLPDECDPDPSTRSPCTPDSGASGHDQDCDGWSNRSDNCPLVINGPAQTDIPGVGNQTDTDGDGIGDACDLNIGTLPGSTVDGQSLPVCLVAVITIGAGGPAPVNPQTLDPCEVTACAGCSSYGDVDCDQEKDVFDLLATMKVLVNIETVPCPNNLPTGCDHELSLADIADFLRYLALYVILPCSPQ